MGSKLALAGRVLVRMGSRQGLPGLTFERSEHRWLRYDSAAAGAQFAGAAVALLGRAAGLAGAGTLNASMASIR